MSASCSSRYKSFYLLVNFIVWLTDVDVSCKLWLLDEPKLCCSVMAIVTLSVLTNMNRNRSKWLLHFLLEWDYV